MRLSLIAVFLFAMFSVLAAQTTDEASSSNLNPAEKALVELMSDYYRELELWWEKLRSYESAAAREEAIEAGKLIDPGEHYIPRLLTFESEHQGEDIGVLALWHIFRQAASTARFNAPAVSGRFEAAQRLTHYQHSPLLPVVVKVALHGKPQVYDAVHSLCNSPAVVASTKDILKFYLATNSFEHRDARQYSIRRVEALRAGGEPTWPRELENHQLLLKAWPSQEIIDQRCARAILSLEELAEKQDTPRFPNIERIDERGYVICLKQDRALPFIAEKAAAALFKERHLVVGAKAPKLEVSLLDNSIWRISDQLGKVVLVQFSFTGCGPCERMYPELAALAAQHSKRLEVLTLMCDDTPDAALEATQSGKLTWSVALDGSPGRIATKWFVTGFPTVYVIDANGKIVSDDDISWKEKHKKVLALVQKAGASTSR